MEEELSLTGSWQKFKFFKKIAKFKVDWQVSVLLETPSIQYLTGKEKFDKSETENNIVLKTNKNFVVLGCCCVQLCAVGAITVRQP